MIKSKVVTTKQDGNLWKDYRSSLDTIKQKLLTAPDLDTASVDLALIFDQKFDDLEVIREKLETKLRDLQQRLRSLKFKNKSLT